MSAILSPCSALWGAWRDDAGAALYGPHSFTIHNWRQPGDPVELQDFSTGTLRRGLWQHNLYVTAPSTVTTHAPATGPTTDPPDPLPNANIWPNYPNSTILTAGEWVGAVYTPSFPYYYSNGVGAVAIYDGGPVYTSPDGTINSRDWSLSTYGQAVDVNTNFACVADLENHTGCCYFPVDCIYPLDDLTGMGIDRDSPRVLTWTVTNDLLSPQDASGWAAIGFPETSQIQISGYWLGDPPP